MARKHKHEEHANHERWVISYADMITLLFALFVVLYALGLDKLDVVAQSIAFAFHFEGDGKTKEEGLFNSGNLGGGILEAPPLINTQPGAMKEFMTQTLPDEFEEITGKSLDIVLLDDTVAFKGKLSGFFQAGKATLDPKIAIWLAKLMTEGSKLAQRVRIRIDTPSERIGVDANNAARRTETLCLERLDHMLKFVRYQVARIPTEHLQVELGGISDAPPAGPPGAAISWEDQAMFTVAFTNQAVK